MAVPVSIDSAESRKARGAFFTPSEVCEFITSWAVRESRDVVLEPSCGAAAFLLPAGRRLRDLNHGHAYSVEQLRAFDLHQESVLAARATMSGAGLPAEISVGDFLALDGVPAFDAVIGNPPYVRYQGFTGDARLRGRAAASRAGVALTGLASSWAAFTVHAASFLKQDGRLGLVLPAELLSVNYAADVRRFLMERFARIRIVLFAERVFPGVLEEVVLLLAEGVGPTDYCELHQINNLGELAQMDAHGRDYRPLAPQDKWTAGLVSDEASHILAAVTAAGAFGVLGDWGDTTLGMVTGNNNYFTLSPARAAQLGLTEADLTPISPPGSRHLRHLRFTAADRRARGESQERTLLFRPQKDPSAAGWAYIAAGEATEVNKAYKCRVRSPWWRTPLLPPADLLLTYMNADTVRLCANEAAAHHLNSVHGVYLRPSLRESGARLLPLATLNSLTLLGAELVGRGYGGGILKLEPREADQLPVPSPDLLLASSSALESARSLVERELGRGRLLEAVAALDEALLIGHLGMSRKEVQTVSEARAQLAERRRARGRKPRVTD